MSRRIRRDLSKRVTSSGYQQIAGDLEVRGKLLGPTATDLATAIGVLSAVTTTPVQLSAPTAQAGMRNIALYWTRQYTLSNFSHYELQVSEDDLYWYSLRLDGSDWCDALNEDTDVRLEAFMHPNIPLVQSGGDLVEKKLYYRVRQVTMAGVKSPWSASVSATTKPVNDLVLTDSYNRYIEISSRKGIYADDRQGHVIHDIPNAPILSDMIYGGHVLWKEAPNYLSMITNTYSDVQVARTVTSAVSNINISAYLGGCTNVKGALVAILRYLDIAASKMAVGTEAETLVRYCTRYNNVIGSTYNHLGRTASRATSAMASSSWILNDISQGLMPVVFDAGIPYLSWYLHSYFAGMTANNNVYESGCFLFLLGLTV